MAVVKISQVRTGMVLAKPVFGRKGAELFSAGESIQEKHIKALKTWGITEINITSEDQAAFDRNDFESEDFSEEEKAAIEKAGVRFQMNDMKDPYIRELFKITTNKILMKNGGEQNE